MRYLYAGMHTHVHAAPSAVITEHKNDGVENSRGIVAGSVRAPGEVAGVGCLVVAAIMSASLHAGARRRLRDRAICF